MSRHLRAGGNFEVIQSSDNVFTDVWRNLKSRSIMHICTHMSRKITVRLTTVSLGRILKSWLSFSIVMVNFMFMKFKRHRNTEL